MPSLHKRRRTSKNKKKRRGGRVEVAAPMSSMVSVPPESFTDKTKKLTVNSTPKDDYTLTSFTDRAKELTDRFPSDEVLNEKINEHPKTVRDNAVNLTSRLYTKIKDSQDLGTIISGFGDLALEEVEKVMKENNIETSEAWMNDFNILKDKLEIAGKMNTNTDESVLATLKELFPKSNFTKDDIHKLTPQDIKVSGEPPKMFKEFIMTDQGGGSKSKRKSKRKGGRSKNKNKTKRKTGGNGRLNIWGPPGRGETSRFSIIFWILVYFFTICSVFFMVITTFRIQPGDQPFRDMVVSVFDYGPTSTETGRAIARTGLGYAFTYAHHALDMIVHFAFGRKPVRYHDDLVGWWHVRDAFLADNNREMSSALNWMSTLIIDWSLYMLGGVIYVIYFIRSIRATRQEKQQINRNLMKWLTMISLIKTILRVCWGLLLRQAAYNSQPDLALSLLQRIMGWGGGHDLWLNVNGLVTWDTAITMPISYFLLQGRSLQQFIGDGGGIPQLGVGSGGGGGGSRPRLEYRSDSGDGGDGGGGGGGGLTFYDVNELSPNIEDEFKD